MALNEMVGPVVELDLVVRVPVTFRVEARWDQFQEIAEVLDANPASVPALACEELVDLLGEEGRAELDSRVVEALRRSTPPPWECHRCGQLTNRMAASGPECPACNGQEVGL